MRHLSLRWSVALLVLGSVFVAQLVGLLILMAFPAPAFPQMTSRQVAMAWRDPGCQTCKALIMTRYARAPFAGSVGGASEMIAATLSALVPDHEIRVRLIAQPALAAGNGSRIASMTTLGAPPGAILRFNSTAALALIMGNVPFPAFEAAFGARDGSWRVIGPAEPFWSWRRRVIAVFTLGLVVMLPVAWLSARRLTRPLEQLAQASVALGHNPQTKPLPVNGPVEVRAAVSAFNGMQARLSRHVNERTEMMAAIAHDLRTPLTSLRLRTETAPRRERARMRADIARMEVMSADLLAFARGESSEVHVSRFDIAELIRECVADAIARGEPVSLGECAPATIVGEPVALRRALDNLLANAVAYGGAALVSVGERAGQLVVSVCDRGPGIPPDQLGRVVEPFVRLEGSRSRNTGGTGLGLAIAARTAVAHGGQLELSNRAAGGLAARLIISGQAGPLAGDETASGAPA